MPPRSMTGFGTAEIFDESFSYKSEIKSLNARYLEISVKLPKALLSVETTIIALAKSKLKRGKVDIFIQTSSLNKTSRLPVLDPAALAHYDGIFKTLNANLASKCTPINPTDFIKLDGVLVDSSIESQTPEEANDIKQKLLLASVSNALDDLVQKRSAEGQVLSDAMLQLISEISLAQQDLESASAKLLSELATHYQTRLSEFILKMSDAEGTQQSILSQITEDRLAAEIALLANKADIAEEITRLGAHIESFKQSLESNSDIGRKLDFLCQEMHREVNTISNKMTHLSVSSLTIAMKQNIERLRQQVQNIE